VVRVDVERRLAPLPVGRDPYDRVRLLDVKLEHEQGCAEQESCEASASM
jgi:hypothetical protein